MNPAHLGTTRTTALVKLCASQLFFRPPVARAVPSALLLPRTPMTLLRPGASPCSPTGHQDRETVRPASTIDTLPSTPPANPLVTLSDRPARLVRGAHSWYERPWRVAAWIAPDDLPRLAAALGPAADVVLCDLLATLAAVVRGGAAAAVLGPAALTCEDVADLAALLVEHPTTVFAPGSPPARWARKGPRRSWRWSRRRAAAGGQPCSRSAGPPTTRTGRSSAGRSRARAWPTPSSGRASRPCCRRCEARPART